MSIIHLSIYVHLENHEMHEFGRPQGPLFHRWLPNGRPDAITVPVKDSRNELKFWFERRGFRRDGTFIHYDVSRKEVDEDAMRRQAVLVAGGLFGEARFAHVMADELTAIRTEEIGSSAYISAGRRVIDFLYGPTAAFVDLLRLQYGQYWLPEIRPWDSRQVSLGQYCSSFGLRWREREDQEWSNFRPTENSVRVTVGPPSGRGYAENLTESDWKYLQEHFDPSATLPLAVRVLGRAHQLSDMGHTNEGIVQAVTALELALEHFVTEQCRVHSAQVADSIRSVSELPLRTQFSIVATASSLIQPAILDNALHGIDLRNRVVHQAAVAGECTNELRALLQCSQALLRLPEFKTPVLSSGNELGAPVSPSGA